jgi:hypothetical protein
MQLVFMAQPQIKGTPCEKNTEKLHLEHKNADSAFSRFIDLGSSAACERLLIDRYHMDITATHLSCINIFLMKKNSKNWICQC